MVIGTCTKWQPFQICSFETFRKRTRLAHEAKNRGQKAANKQEPFPPMGTCIGRYKIENQSHNSICMCWESLKRI